MINDLVPTGFSSVAAMTLLKTMDTSMASNNSFLATADTTAFDTTSKKTVSGDTMFSIIAAAASAKAATAPAATQASSSTAAGQTAASTITSQQGYAAYAATASTPADAAAGDALYAADPYLQKSYTVAQATDIYYGTTQRYVDFANNTPGGNPTGASAGTVIAAMYSLSGDAAKSFATAYDTRTLKFSDPNAISGLNSVVTHTVTHGSDGYINGESYGQTFDENVMGDYVSNHPNTLILTSASFGSWQGALVSW